jgi:methylenetetrahydrofolate/methylenetetrahydromethanopterin dehydrogenase (NADP+)
MKRILIQLDTDPHASPFDAIVAHDADVDVLLPYAGVEPGEVVSLIQGAFFTRGPDDLHNTAVWVGGTRVGDGEAVLAAVQEAFFGPFKVSVMLDSNGSNTTAATAVALLAKDAELKGRKAVIVGAGSVGLRSAVLLEQEGCEVAVAGIPADRFKGEYRRARGLDSAEEQGFAVVEPGDDDELRAALDGAAIALAAGPAGVELLPEKLWSSIDSLEVLVDYNAAEPLGVAGSEANDEFAERNGKRVLGALAVGGPKMKVHKACIRRLFEANDLVMDTEGVYEVARELV